MDNVKIGKIVAKLRKQQEMSTTELAKKTGLSQPQISRLENGRQGFRSATLSRIAETLNVPVSYFFDDEKDTVREARRKQDSERKNMGREFYQDLSAQFGDLVVTPGYRQILKKLTTALSRESCDPRTLRRLIDKIVSMNNTEREKLLARLKK